MSKGVLAETREAERKGLRMDFPFLLSTTAAAGSVWQYGFSSSGPLLMNTLATS